MITPPKLRQQLFEDRRGLGTPAARADRMVEPQAAAIVQAAS